MELTVNGEQQVFNAPLTVEALLKQMALDSRKVAVELNGAIVPKSAYAAQAFSAGDVVEIVGFIGGG